jgi:uncharacterized damage-inducible protein DinB
MGEPRYVPLQVGGFWADLNDHLLELVDLVPDTRLEWTPAEGAWSIRQLVLHIAGARYHWMANSVKDGSTLPPPLREARTKDELAHHLQESWARIARFISDPARLGANYEPPPHDPDYLDPAVFNGHYIAYHRLVHDVHHRADLLGYLATLGLELPSSRRRRPLL